MRSVPDGTVTSTSSTTTVTSAIGVTVGGRDPFKGTRTARVREEVLGELAEGALRRRGREVAQRAQGLAADLLADRLQHRKVTLAAGAGLEALQDLVLPHGPLSAGHALAAGLVAEEAREALQRVDDA